MNENPETLDESDYHTKQSENTSAYYNTANKMLDVLEDDRTHE